MFTVHPDRPTTRRKAHHYVLDENGNLAWTGAKMGDLLIFLWETGHFEFLVDLGNVILKATLVKEPD